MGTSTYIKTIVLIWLSVCAWQDWKRGEVSNWLTIPSLLASAAYALLQGKGAMILFAAAVVGLTILYYLNAVGGADVKILSALAGLWPTAFWGSLIMQGIWGLVVLVREGRGAEFRAVPVFALGTAISWLINI